MGRTVRKRIYETISSKNMYIVDRRIFEAIWRPCYVDDVGRLIRITTGGDGLDE